MTELNLKNYSYLHENLHSEGFFGVADCEFGVKCGVCESVAQNISYTNFRTNVDGFKIHIRHIGSAMNFYIQLLINNRIWNRVS